MSISLINSYIKTPSQKSKSHTQMYMGEMLELCGRDVIRKNMDIKTFLHWIKPAILHDQFLFLQNDGEVQASGYLTWAFVNDETLQRYIQTPRFVLHASEWNEGNHLIIVDFCAIANSKQFIRKLLKQAHLLVEYGVASITVCIRNEIGAPMKVHRIYKA